MTPSPLPSPIRERRYGGESLLSRPREKGRTSCNDGVRKVYEKK